MSWLIKHLKLISLLSLFLWGGVIQAQSVKKFGRETQAKFQKLNPYKLGQFKYARPHSILEGRKFRLKLLVPYADTTSYKESATGRKWSFEGYTSSEPYSVYFSYKWLGIGKTSMAYHLESEFSNYLFNMEWQDVGLTFGLQRRFLLRKGKRSYGGVSSVYRSNVTIGMGQITQGDLTLTRITKAIGSESKQEFYSDIKKGNAWFILYAWEFYQSENISIEAVAGYRENSIVYSPPEATVGGSTFAADEDIKGSITQYFFGFGLSF